MHLRPRHEQGGHVFGVSLGPTLAHMVQQPCFIRNPKLESSPKMHPRPWIQGNFALQFGQLGSGDTEDALTPRAVAGALQGKETVLLACGWRHSLAVTAEGEVFSWGRGVNGQLGHGDVRDGCTFEFWGAQF